MAGRDLPLGARRARQPDRRRGHGHADRLSSGKFLNASVDKASDENERNGLVIRLADGRDIAIVQIAGLIARRILCHAREGQAVQSGARFGIIRFGSRTDTYLPEGVAPLVSVGQTMIGGETVIAALGAPLAAVLPAG